MAYYLGTPKYQVGDWLGFHGAEVLFQILDVQPTYYHAQAYNAAQEPLGGTIDVLFAYFDDNPGYYKLGADKKLLWLGLGAAALVAIMVLRK